MFTLLSQKACSSIFVKVATLIYCLTEQYTFSPKPYDIFRHILNMSLH